MRKVLKTLLLSIIVLLMCSSFCFASDVTPISNRATDTSTPVDIAWVDSDKYIIDDNVLISDNIDGNVFVIADQVTVTSQINGNLFVIADTLTIDNVAMVSNSVFAIASTMTVEGYVKDIYAMSNTFTLESQGIVSRDLKFYGKSLALNGTVEGDAYIGSDAISIPENAEQLIHGDFYYTAYKQLAIPEGAVGGEVKFTERKTPTLTTQQIISGYVSNFFTVILYALAIILFVYFAVPTFADKLTNSCIKRPIISASVGLVAFFAFPLLALAFLMTGVLSYVSIALLAIYIFLISITLPILSIALGNYFAGKLKSKTKLKVILLSTLSAAVLWGLQRLPWVGTYASIFTIIFGLGILLFALFGKKQVAKK